MAVGFVKVLVGGWGMGERFGDWGMNSNLDDGKLVDAREIIKS